MLRYKKRNWKWVLFRTKRLAFKRCLDYAADPPLSSGSSRSIGVRQAASQKSRLGSRQQTVMYGVVGSKQADQFLKSKNRSSGPKDLDHEAPDLRNEMC